MINRLIDLGNGGNWPMGAYLKAQAQAHFGAVRGASVGIGYDSCDAALAILYAGYRQYPRHQVGNRSFSILFANSQIYKGHDNDANALGRFGTNEVSNSDLGQHAEQMVIGLANHLNLPLLKVAGVAQIWTTYPPCYRCNPWYNTFHQPFDVYYN